MTCFVHSKPSKYRIILDGDFSAMVENGLDLDDDFALLLALKSQKIEILGVTTTFGNGNNINLGQNRPRIF